MPGLHGSGPAVHAHPPDQGSAWCGVMRGTIRAARRRCLERYPLKIERELPGGDAVPPPLAGLRVLELGHIVAGPTAGQILADLGADVLKIEAVNGGDQARGTPGSAGAAFHFFNRNKGSLALDLKGRGREVFLRLAGDADIIVDNFAYGAVDGLGVGYDVVSVGNPRVIWLSIKGFLPGAAEGRPLLDELAQMMGGLAYMTGPEGQPLRAGASVIDMGAATYGVIGVMAALRQRDATGRGQRITAGLYETSVYWVGQWMAVAQNSGEPSVPMPVMQQGTRMGWGVYRLFTTADGDEVFIGITSNAHWQRFCDAFSLVALKDDPAYADNRARVSRRNELGVVLGELIGRLRSDEVQRRLLDAQVPHAPLRRPDQLHREPALRDSGQLVDTPLPSGRSLALPKMPIRAEGFDMALRRPAPALGEDSREVLAKLGYSPADIEELIASGAVGGPPGA